MLDRHALMRMKKKYVHWIDRPGKIAGADGIFMCFPKMFLWVFRSMESSESDDNFHE